MEEKFGSIMFDGKIVNLDNESMEKLAEISEELTEKYNTLIKKTLTVFNQ